MRFESTEDRAKHCFKNEWTFNILLRSLFNIMCDNFLKQHFSNYVDKILAFFDHLPPFADILWYKLEFSSINIDKKLVISTTLPPSSCKRSFECPVGQRDWQ